MGGHAWKEGSEVPSLERMGMLFGRDGTLLQPAAQGVGRGLHQGSTLPGIGTSTRTGGEIQLEDGTACRFAHDFPALSSSLHRADDEFQNCSRLQELRSFWVFPQASIPVLERFVQVF